jgi:hypothetical protein
MSLTRILTTAVLGLAILGGTASAAQAAALTPVIYNDAAGWSHPSVRPVWIVIGEGGAPAAHTWHWSSWGPKSATSTGTLWVNNCRPDCALGKTSYHHLVVTLSGVKYHNGRAYYSMMTWYTPGYRLGNDKTSTYVLHANRGGYWG